MVQTESAKHRALALIKDEHRSLAAVVHALQYLTRQAVAGQKPSTELLDAIVQYLLQFPEKMHHPAEDRWIFAPLMAKTKESNDVLTQLKFEHAAGAVREQRLSAALSQYKDGLPGGSDAFAKAVEDYARFYWAHMVTEETLILPLAERILSGEDWDAAADGFAANHDPMYGSDTGNEFDALFKRIVYLAPPPIGFGGSA